MLIANEWVGAAILAAVFLGVLAFAEAWRYARDPGAETTRKLVHVTGGVACLFFPFLVQSWQIILGMALALSTLFALARRYGFLRSLHGVRRSSRGAEYYPVSVFLLFLFAQGRDWLYLASVLTLAVGDGFAALIGTRYGKIHYRVEEDRKSLEGSMAFLVIAFLAVHLPLLLLTEFSREVVVLSALHVAIIVTGLEAIALKGTDNLWVPLGAAFIISKITIQPLSEVVYQNVSLLLIFVGIAIASWRIPALHAGAKLVLMLYAYGTWALGGRHWALPVFTGLAGFFLALHIARAGGRNVPEIGVRAVQSAVLPIFAILLLANTLHEHQLFYGAFVAANATALALGLVKTSFRFGGRVAPRSAVAAIASTIACGAVLLPPLAAQHTTPLPAPGAIWMLLLPVAYLNARREKRAATASGYQWRWFRILWCLAVAVAVFGLQQSGIIPPWNPYQRW